MQSLCLDIKILGEDNEEIEIKEDSDTGGIAAIEKIVDSELYAKDEDDEDFDEDDEDFDVDDGDFDEEAVEPDEDDNSEETEDSEDLEDSEDSADGAELIESDTEGESEEE